jgi:hypothetical protein
VTPLPFVTPRWLRYLDMLEQHGYDLGGDDLAVIATEEQLERDLQALIHATPGRVDA